MKKNEKNHFSHFGKRRAHNEYGQSWILAAALLDGPRTIEQFEEYYRIMGRRFGVFVDVLHRSRSGARASEDVSKPTKMRSSLERGLTVVLKLGWITRQGNLYYLSEKGRGEAELMLRDLEKGGRMLEKMTHPETVSKVTLIVHFILAAIKLPAALISGSVGLLNDSLDTLMDGISSLCVFFGVRAGRERLVSYVLLIFMTLTGGYTLYEAVTRFIHPEPLTADWTAFIAVTISAVLCSLLWLYQKYSGIKHSCVPLIAQSIDSRNHIIVAGGVAAGLIAAWFQFTLLDQIVGIVVAALILKAAAELLLDLLRSSNDDEIDLSKYGFSRLEAQRHLQMVRWFLFEIEEERITSREQMLREAKIANDYSTIASFRALGIDCQADQEEKLNAAILEVFDRGFVREIPVQGENPPREAGKVLQLTDTGEEELNRALANGWNFRQDGVPGSSRLYPIRILGSVLRFFFAAALFTVLYSLIRWILGYLPDLDVWASGAFPGKLLRLVMPGAGPVTGNPTVLYLKEVLTLRSYSAGPFSISGAQILCCLIGVFFTGRGRMLIHRGRHLIHHAKEGGMDRPAYIISDGLFAKRRHPMYAGMLLMSAGIGIGLHSVYTLAWAGISMLIRILNARYEEKQLAGWFSEEYIAYKERVKRRLFPWWTWCLLAVVYCAAWIGL